MPVATRSSTTRSARSGSAMSVSSVISMRSRDAGTPWRTSAAPMSVAQPSSRSVAADTLTATDRSSPRRVPGGDLAQRGVEDVLGELAHHAGLLGERDERAGRRAGRARGAIQRTSASTPSMRPRSEVELGLEVQDELLGADRVAQLADELEALARVAVALALRRRRCPLRAALAWYIATSARCSSVSASSPCSGNTRDADARADPDVDAVDVKALLQRARDPAGRRARRRRRPARTRRTRRRRGGRACRRRAAPRAAAGRSARARCRRRGGRACR